MKRSTRMISLVLSVTLISLFTVIPALALPPLPSSFFGTVKVNGGNVPDGTPVQAWINGQLFSESLTLTYQGNSIYNLDIPGDDTNTPAVDGGREGDVIQFKIDGKLAAQTATWHSSTNVNLNLTRSTAPTPISPTPIPTRQNPFLKSQVLIPYSLTTQFGMVSGSLSSLNLPDQTGTEDNPAAYLSFQTPNTIFMGYQTFTLPADVRPLWISTLLLQVNFKGPESSTQTWTWSIYDWGAKQWVKIGDSVGVKPEEWQTLIFRIRQPWRFISSGRAIRIQLKSNNSQGDAKVDYEALHLTYLSIPATPTPVTPMATPGRPGISSASTSTPKP